MTAAPTESTDPTTSSATTLPALRGLYFARFAFAIAWAALFALTASPYRSTALALAVLYPAVDALAVAIDARSAAAAGRSAVVLYVNTVLSAASAIALAVVIQRRAQKGQIPMILSGSISVLAGGSFVASAHDATSLKSIAGYAVLGGLFFLVSALRLKHRER
jgi:hypothetical protein